MSLTQGYQQSGAMAEGLKSQLEAAQDKPAGKIMAPAANDAAAGSRPDSSAVGVPGYYHTQDQAADTMMAYRMGAAGVAPVTPGAAGVTQQSATYNYLRDYPQLKNFKVDLTPADIAFFEQRRAEQQQIEFDSFFAETIDLSDPAQARWAQQMYPEFWARREKFIDDRINVESRASKIRLRGIKDKEDLKFLFAVRKGYIQLPTAPAYQATPGGENSYKRGFFASRPAIGNSTGGAPAISPAAFVPTQGQAGGASRDLLLGGFL